MSVKVLGSPRVVIQAAPANRVHVAARGMQGKSGADWQTYVFQQPALSWHIHHGKGVRRFAATVRSTAGELQLLTPRVVSDNEIAFDFDEPTAGSVDILFEVK